MNRKYHNYALVRFGLAKRITEPRASASGSSLAELGDRIKLLALFDLMFVAGGAVIFGPVIES